MPNAREMLKNVADFLGDEEEDLSFGLRSAFDALRLYDYAQSHPELTNAFVTEWKSSDRIKALGYDPMAEPISHESHLTGCIAVTKALTSSRKILNSAAFVLKEGDTRKPIELIDAVLSC